MSHFILFLLLLLASCATAKREVHKHQGISPMIRPYVANFKMNSPHKNRAELKEDFPVNFDPHVTTVGVCYLREKVSEREVLINQTIWEQYPEKREYIIKYLVGGCYTLNPKTHPYYEVHLTGI